MKKQITGNKIIILGILFFLLSGSIVLAEGPRQLMMATTTSTDNTGLLDYLAPKFQSATGIELKWTGTGTGKALKLGENCDVDVLMVHAPAAEKAFVDSGFGMNRREIMYNDFVIIGPDLDPAGIKGKSVQEALKMIKGKGAVFASRGDNSGTHKKELSLWESTAVGVPEKEAWYVQTGQGMLATINIAVESNGYTLTDRGTYIKYADNMKGHPPLKIVVEKDTELLNQYSVIAVNPKHCANIKYSLAMKFINWITTPEAQEVIKEYKLLGKSLFIPNTK